MTDRKLPVGIQSFEKIITDGYIYVDKTKYIWNLVCSGSVYFLSRPRRFGKSLLISTMEAYFQGKKELFRGLAIEELENGRGEDAWLAFPVIKFSLSGGNYNVPDGLEEMLTGAIEETRRRYKLKGNFAAYGRTPALRFKTLIELLYVRTGRPVVVLVDEYDKPLLETMIVNKEQEEKNRQLYKGFFSVLKDEDQYLKFVFFTGVTKFSKVSIFSDLNQLDDISLMNEMSGICGISEREMRENFRPEIQAMAAEWAISEEECRDRLAKMYDGYHFSPGAEGVYNPFSLLNAFQKKDFGRYWFETATPTFLIRKLQASNFTPEKLADGVETSETALMDYRDDNPNPIPLFFQTGYLTICGFDREFRIYELKFPNDEVKYGFLNYLAPYVLGEADAERPLSSRNMVRALQEGRVEECMTILESMFAAIPYIDGKAPGYEQEWRNEVFLIFMLTGQHVACEVHSATGRADCIVKTDRYIYIFEFKLDKSADEALAQIEEKGYALPYKADPRQIIKIGVNFSSEKRNIGDWKVRK